MFLNKCEQREKIKSKLKLETKEAIHTASSVINNNLIKVVENLPSPISSILAWVPCFTGEVDLTDFIRTAISKYDLYLPKVDTTKSLSTMHFLRLDANWQNKLQLGSGKYKEPEGGEEFIPSQSSVTLVILPALAFDKSGNRLGRGKGHYDKFLSSVKDYSFIKVGVCLDWQVFDEIPVEEHDIPVDIICTEKQILVTPTLVGKKAD